MQAARVSIPAEIFRQVRAIEIRTRRLVNELFSGQYGSVFKGRGMEFAQVRQYQDGDDPKLIDWNVSARAGHLFTKEFMEERELTVILLLDASRSLFFGSRRGKKSELAAELAALLAFSAIRNNDKVGLAIFTDRIEKYVPPQKGARAILRLIREILTFHPEGRATNLTAGIEFIGKVMKRKSVIFLMSDFLSPMDYERSLGIISRKHDLIAVRISDRWEEKFFSAGRFWLRDLESGRRAFLHVTEKDLSKLQAKLTDHFAEWRSKMSRHGVDRIEVKTGEPYSSALLSFFRARAKRLR